MGQGNRVRRAHRQARLVLLCALYTAQQQEQLLDFDCAVLPGNVAGSRVRAAGLVDVTGKEKIPTRSNER